MVLNSQGHSKRSSWSGFGQTTIFQGKNKISFCKKQVISKSTRMIFGLVQLLYYDTLDKKPKDEVKNNWPLTHTN